jgi:hypothetical protein
VASVKTNTLPYLICKPALSGIDLLRYAGV